jgi:hypothetical protein
VKALKIIVAVGMTAALGMGLVACGSTYTGEGTVTNKQIDRTTHTNSTSKTKRTTTDYEITVDVPTSDVNQIIDVSKDKYDKIQVGQKVTVKDGKIQ